MLAAMNRPATKEFPFRDGAKLRRSLVLVATDGSENSRSAYAAAELIAEHQRTRVHVLSVVEPLPPVISPPGSPLVSPVITRAREDALRTDMVEQLLRLGRLSEWTTEMRTGTAASVIAEVARERGVDLVIIGASHHGFVDRLLGGETAANLARLIDRPVLIASPSFARLPKRAIVAFELAQIDRSPLARALAVLAAPPSLSVVHVEPESVQFGIDWAQFDSEYRSEVERLYDEVKTILSAVPRIKPELVVLHGNVVREISRFGDSISAELLVVGVKRRRSGVLSRSGGMAMKLARAARCAVLLIPEAVS